MLVILEPVDSLAVHLFLYAHVIACAIENHTSVINPEFADFAQYFEGTRDDFLPRFPPPQIPAAPWNSFAKGYSTIVESYRSLVENWQIGKNGKIASHFFRSQFRYDP